MGLLTDPSDEDIECLLSGLAPAQGGLDDLADLVDLVGEVRSAYCVDLGRAVEDRHVASVVAAAHLASDKGEPVVRPASKAYGPDKQASGLPKWRKRTVFSSLFASISAKVAGVAMAATAATGGLAATGHLPAPAQTAVASVVEKVGIEIPKPVKEARDHLKDTVDKAKQARDELKDTRGQVRDSLKDARGEVKDALEKGHEQIKDARDAFKDARGQGPEAVKDARNQLKDAIKDAHDQLKDARGNLKDTREQAKDTLRDAREQVKDDLGDVRDAHEQLMDARQDVLKNVETPKPKPSSTPAATPTTTLKDAGTPAPQGDKPALLSGLRR